MEKLSHSPTVLVSLFIVPAFLIWLVFWLFAVYRDKEITKKGILLTSETSFYPADIANFRYSSLALVSLLCLFMEMLMIRWISSEVRVFAYFKNLVLVACFLGFGLGCYLCRRRMQVMAMIAPVLVLTVILKTPLSPLRQVIAMLPQMLGGGTEIRIWGVPALPTSWLGTVLALLVIVPLFAIVAMMFVPVGQLIGWYLEASPNGVTAYTVNVLASLAGIAIYTGLCFLYQPPAVWMIAAGILSVLAFWQKKVARQVLAVSFVLCVLLLSLRDHKQAHTYWSPYQKLDLRANYENGRIISYTLNTNDSWYQQIVDLSPEFVRSHPDDFRELPAEWRAYNIPYKFYREPESVLVLGAGMGNDVAAALRNGAHKVVAVEIDPLILKLGRQLHFEHPYQSPRTQVVVADARSYIQNSHEKFDLIIFSLLDSHTTASYFSNIRIDNYVYTREALARARELLKDDGLFVIKFQVDVPWIVGRLQSLMWETFRQAPLQFQTETSRYDTGGRFFIAGARDKIDHAMSDPQLAGFVAAHSGMRSEGARITTDDWPYFYQREPGLPMTVILVSIAVLVTFGWFLRQAGPTGTKIDIHFFLLGAGFMLLEAQIVSRMALLFGTTWVVNTIVVSGLLCLIVAANFLHQRFPRLSRKWGFAGLFASLALSSIVPVEALLFESLVVRLAVSTTVLCIPVLFAGLVFVSSFEKANFQGTALGSNLFGSLAGGLLESLSMWFGLKSLIVIAAIIYIASAICLFRRIPAPEPVSVEVI